MLLLGLGIQGLFSARQPLSLGSVISVGWRLVCLKMCQSCHLNENKVASAGPVDAPMGIPCFSSSSGCSPQASGSSHLWLHRQGCVPKPNFYPSPGTMEGEFPQLGLICTHYPSAAPQITPELNSTSATGCKDSLACPSCLASREREQRAVEAGEADFPRAHLTVLLLFASS